MFDSKNTEKKGKCSVSSGPSAKSEARTFARALLVVLVGLLCATALPARATGNITIDFNAPYNLVVDSNVLSPSTYAPELGSVGAQICNYGDSPLSDVVAYIGDYSAGTPGVYPVRDSDNDSAFQTQHPHLSNTGPYSLTHHGGSLGELEAVRYIGNLAVGQCVWQYWHFTYPRTDPDETVPVWGDTNNPNDDLWLTLDVWATSAEGPQASMPWKVTMRNEISASANKIYPNGGDWFTTPGEVAPGQTITTTGVNYDMGVINKGFDNDGDGDYDYNAWLQPIGDASYDPSCFRLVETSGQLIIKRGGGNPDYVYDFQDELYFTDLPEDNSGGTGVVYYTFLSLGGPCAIPMTPYQEVASGADNEKFAGDYGILTTTLTSTGPEVDFDKAVDLAQAGPTDTLTYTMDFANTGDDPAGLPDYGVGLVIKDSIPPDTTYVSGSADATLGFSPNNGVRIIFSDDGGFSWSSNEPSAASVTDIQWWLQDPLPAGTSGTGTVSFKVTIDSPYLGQPVVENTGYAAFGNSVPFAEDTVGTLVNGTNSIGDFVWRDDDYDGAQDAGEPGIESITVTLYWDRNGDGELDGSDLAVLTTSTDSGGNYLFSNIPDGDWLIVPDKDDPDLPTGYANTTAESYAATGLSGGTSITDADFGFGPSLIIDKTLTSADPAYEGDQVSYSIDVTNVRPSTQGPCTYTVWAENAESPFSTWLNPANATGGQGPDGFFAGTDSAGGGNDIRVDTWGIGTQPGAITKVEAVMVVYIDQDLVNDSIDGVVYFGPTATEIQRDTFAPSNFNTPTPPGYCCSQAVAAEFTWDVTTARAWTWADFPNAAADGARLALEFKHTGGTDAANFFVDSLGFRITSDATCGGLDDDMSLVPLTDSFDADLLTLVSTSEPYDNLSSSGSAPSTIGTITWNDIGPLLAGQTKTIDLVFEALEPPDSGTDGEPDSASLVNTADSTGATFYDGDPVNDATDSATSTLDPAGTIGDTVYNDNGGLTGSGTAGNGVQDGDEAGIANVTVRLYSDPNGDGDISVDGVLLDTQITDANGEYLFVGVPTGDYVVVVDTTTLPGGGSGLTPTGDPDVTGTCTPGVNCDNQGLSVIDYTNGNTTLDDDDTLDFGYQVPNTIFGNVWEDNSGDGTQDAGENGLAGITVELSNGTCTVGTNCPTTTTDADGNYSFGNVADGTYQVIVDTSTLPAGGTWSQTADPDSTLDSQTTSAISVSGGNVYGSYDFAYTEEASSSISGLLYADWNGDAHQDTGEEGIQPITVVLYEDSNGDGIVDPSTDAVVATTTTASDGTYSFSRLPAGDYIVQVNENDDDFPSAWIQTEDPDETSICVVCNGQASITLDGTSTAGTGAVSNVDFGYHPYGNSSIGDYIWNDADGDGIQDDAEFGIANVSIYLYEDSNGDGHIDGDDALVAFTTGDGSYLFTDLPAGDYIVDIDVTDPQIPTDTYGNTYVLSYGTDELGVALTTTTSFLEADYGFAPGAVIGDRIWQDDDGDGSQLASEPGIANVTVWLYTDPNGDGDYSDGTLIDTQVTDSNGDYLFTGVSPGDYVVVTDTSDPDLPSTDVTGDPDGTYDGSYGLTVQAGKNYLFADFGFQPPGTIGDALWIDANGDGVYDPVAEVGIGGITVELRDGTCSPAVDCRTTTTDANGYYTFGNVSDGSYTVHPDPSGLEIPSTLSLTFDPDETNPCSTCDGVGSVTISGGNTDLSIDFGYTETPTAELVIDKDTTTPTINAGGRATYTISIRNYGDAAATLVDISDTLPGIGDAACASPGCFTLASVDSISMLGAATTRTTTSNPTNGSASLTWGQWTIAANGGGVDIEFTVNVDANTPQGTYDNTASATFDSTGGNTQDTTIDDDGTQPQDADTPPSRDPENDEDVTIAELPTLGVTKTSSAAGSTFAGDTIDYQMVITNSGPGIANNVVVNDSVPTGTSFVGASATVTTPVSQPVLYFADDFESGTYSGARTDSQTWGTNWIEIGETTDPTSGNVTLLSDGGDTVLSIERTGNGAYRQANLSAYSLAYLTFDYRRVGLDDAGDILGIDVSSDGGTTWSDVTSIAGTANDSSYQNAGVYEISDYISTNTRIRFVADNLDNDDFVYINDVEISVFERIPTALTAHDPSGLVIASDSHDLLVGESMTVTFSVEVDNPIPAGLTSIDNTVYVTSAEIRTPVTDSTSDNIPAAPTGSIGDTVFDDNGDGGATAEDGVQNGTEPGLSNITVILYSDPNGDGDPSDGAEIGRKVTDSNGEYLFTGLPSGDYVVDIDEDSLPTNYTLTSSTEPFPVNLVTNASTFSDADFGYFEQPPTPLPVTLASFRATGDGYRLRFEWSTETETGNVGFVIFALVDRQWKQLHKDIIESHHVDSIGHQEYSFEVYGVDADTFVIGDIDVRGKTRYYGPIRLNERWGSVPIEPEPIPWQEISSEHQRKLETRHRDWRRTEQPDVRVAVSESGLHRITCEQLVAAGADFTGVGLDQFALFFGTQSIPIEVTGDRFFGAGSEIIFIGEKSDSLYNRAKIYSLTLDARKASRIIPDTTRLAGSNTHTSLYNETLFIENDNAYSASSPIDDPWYDRWLRAIGKPDSITIPLTVENYRADGEAAQLKLGLWGVTDWPEDPDHHVVVTLNGYEIANDLFDGQVAHPIDALIPRGVLQEGVNELKISLPFDVPVSWDLVALDTIELSYPRQTSARSGRLEFTSARASTLLVDSLPSKDVRVYRSTSSNKVERLLGVEISAQRSINGPYQVAFNGHRAEATYLVSTSDSMLVPELSLAPPTEEIMDGKADYLIISHPDFVTELDDFIRSKESDGYDVELVDVEQIYRQFSSGMVDPEAIRAFIAHAYYTMGTRYVLLVGGDTYDYKDNLGLGATSFIPSLYVPTGQWVSHAPADPIYGDVNGDGVPEVAIGRFPVRTSAELASIVKKTMIYSRIPYPKTLIAASDAYSQSEEISFSDASNLLLDQLDAAWSITRADMDVLGLEQARNTITASINSGRALTQYFGHSGPSTWSLDQLFTSTDAANLENFNLPTVVVQWGCWNTYYVAPTFNTMGHKLMLSGDQGAAAVLGAATLTTSESDLALGRFFLPRLIRPGMPIGMAVVEAKRDLADQYPNMIDVLYGWTILGDPSLVVVEQER